MNAKTKSIAIIIGTLLVGIIIGSLATGAIFSNRVSEFQALRMENGLTRFLEQIIEPTDEAQQAKIREVLDNTAAKQMGIRKSIADEHRAVFEEMREELSLILTPEQKTKLRAWMERDRRGRPGFPPPGMGRPDGSRFDGRMPFDSTDLRRPQRGFRQGGKPLPVDSTGR